MAASPASPPRGHRASFPTGARVHQHARGYYFSLPEEVQRGEPSETRETQFRGCNCPGTTLKHQDFVPLLLGPLVLAILNHAAHKIDVLESRILSVFHDEPAHGPLKAVAEFLAPTD